MHLPLKLEAIGSVTRGLVGDTSFAFLPEISPRTTFVITIWLQLVALIKLFYKPTFEVFLGALTLCGYASFFFGWHVHEKAVLLVILPASLLALRDTRYFYAFRPLLQAGCVSLLPLIYTGKGSSFSFMYPDFESDPNRSPNCCHLCGAVLDHLPACVRNSDSATNWRSSLPPRSDRTALHDLLRAFNRIQQHNTPYILLQQRVHELSTAHAHKCLLRLGHPLVLVRLQLPLLHCFVKRGRSPYYRNLATCQIAAQDLNQWDVFGCFSELRNASIADSYGNEVSPVSSPCLSTMNEVAKWSGAISL